MSRKPWAVPEWMRPYLPFVTDGGGQNIDLADERTLAQIAVLIRLHNAGLLRPAPPDETG